MFKIPNFLLVRYFQNIFRCQYCDKYYFHINVLETFFYENIYSFIIDYKVDDLYYINPPLVKNILTFSTICLYCTWKSENVDENTRGSHSESEYDTDEVSNQETDDNTSDLSY